MRPPPCFDDAEARKVMDTICRANTVDVALIRDACEVVLKHSGTGRADGVNEDVTQCIDGFIRRLEQKQRET